jgi:two-component system sensor histidine kinase UhpB
MEPEAPDLTAKLSASQRFLLLMDHSLDFIELLGAEGTIEAISAAIKPLGGYDPSDLIGRPYRDIIHPDDCARASKAFAGVLGGQRPGPVTLRYRRKDGSWRTVQVSARNFLDDPAVRAIVILTRDLTDQLEAENSLAEANVELRRLSQQLLVAQETERSYIAAELHDDVQQILVGLRMSMEPVRRTMPDLSADVIDGWIQWVQEAIDRLHNLTSTLRAPVIGNRGLGAELRTYIDRLSVANGREILLEADASLGWIEPEIELACLRIVQEGLANAIKHSGAKHLRVCLTRTGADLTVSVRDDGIGFDVRSARALAVERGSIGLLSMRERAALAGGRLEIESSAGQGTRICAIFRSVHAAVEPK